MNLNIRERTQKVLQSLQAKTHQSIRAIAQATGIPKSSVHRHLHRIKRRQRNAASEFWETQAGGDWLRLLVFGVIYCFGIKGGIGSDSLSSFFHLLHLEEQIGCSASALRDLEIKLRDQIIAYGEAQRASCQGESAIGICLGADETFNGLPILVAIELASGFIFTEVACENRTYATWWEQISAWYSPAQWDCRGLVSDGAKALVKLGLSGLGCPSLPDVFHLLYGLSKSIGTGIARQQQRLQNQVQALQAKRQTLSSETKLAELEAQLLRVQAQRQQVETDRQTYEQGLHALSQAIHPFDLNTGESQLGLDLPTRLTAILASLDPLGLTYASQAAQAALALWHRQIPNLSLTLHAWWHWTLQALKAQTQDPDIQDWVLTALLPWLYWHQQTQKTRNPKLKSGYGQAAQQAQTRLLAHPLTQSLSPTQQQLWIDWAIWMCAKFQRSSSAVEGRNGYLSQIHHANRGLSPQTLNVLTIIHNFDLKRTDGSTAAQRLFGHPFPDLFDSVVSQMGELPSPRKSKKPRTSKIPTIHAVPA